MEMNGSKIVLESLKTQGVTTIFGYPGGAVIPLYDELLNYSDSFTHVRSNHEQHAVHAADGYARISGKPGVCFVTSGPGATNTITGIANAYMDSVPLIVITGQVPTSILGKDSFQEIDITGLTMSITKHNFLVHDVRDLEQIVKEAHKIATEGRPGPVLIDIPKDIFNATYEYKGLELNNSKDKKKPEIDSEKIEQALELIKTAEQPVIFAGGGIKISKATEALRRFVKTTNIPIANSLMGLGTYPRDDELSLGMVGMHGFSETNLALSQADVILAIGVRFSDRVTGNPERFAKDAKVIHVDIDNTELDKNIFCDLPIVGDAKEVLEMFNAKIDFKKDTKKWVETIEQLKSKEVTKNEFHPKNILEAVNNSVQQESIVVTDVGQHQMWAAQYWNFQQPDTFVTSGGLGTMGYGLGAAIGSKVANRDQQVVLITGDGSFRMNANELIIARKYDLPILMILFNNNTLGMVRQWQKMFSHQRYSETDVNDDLDYILLAKAHGIEGRKVKSMEELNETLSQYDSNESLLIECMIDVDENVLPIVPPGEEIDKFIL